MAYISIECKVYAARNILRVTDIAAHAAEELEEFEILPSTSQGLRRYSLDCRLDSTLGLAMLYLT